MLGMKGEGKLEENAEILEKARERNKDGVRVTGCECGHGVWGFC